MVSLQGIKNIIFDFGGVILNLDFKAGETAFARLGVTDFAELYSQINQVHIFDDLEKGIISPTEFNRRIHVLINKDISDEDLNIAWNSMLGEMPPQRIRTLLRLKNIYRTFLLSNSNAIHYAVFVKELQEKYGFASFDELFERVYFSFRERMKKPDPEIYNYVLHTSNLIPEETLFIEDTEKNLVPARQLGIHTYLLQPGEDISTLF
ncbi:MAG: HAD family phosphatase [Lentimicrobiaceae bacterium]|nr:HAD family phosphatase [Lentimicrobiaceae bacterium]